MGTWDAADPNVLELPSGRLVRGRSLRRGPVAAECPADFELILLGSQQAFDGLASDPRAAAEYRWVRWHDFWLPANPHGAAGAFAQAWRRAGSERVSVACSGGRGRTGTALACIAVIDGVPPGEAVDFVRRGYNLGAVETPWQKRFVRGFTVR